MKERLMWWQLKRNRVHAQPRDRLPDGQIVTLSRSYGKGKVRVYTVEAKPWSDKPNK